MLSYIFNFAKSLTKISANEDGFIYIINEHVNHLSFLAELRYSDLTVIYYSIKIAGHQDLWIIQRG